MSGIRCVSDLSKIRERNNTCNKENYSLDCNCIEIKCYSFIHSISFTFCLTLAHPSPPHPTPRPIIVKFTNYDSKYKINSRRLRLRKLNLMEKFGMEQVFINTNLTSRHALLYLSQSLPHILTNTYHLLLLKNVT